MKKALTQTGPLVAGRWWLLVAGLLIGLALGYLWASIGGGRSKAQAHALSTLPVEPELSSGAAESHGDVDLSPELDASRDPMALEVTVGATGADFLGTSHRSIQAALDYVAGLGGGRVRLLEGEFTLANAVFLRSGVDLQGAGSASVLKVGETASSALSRDGAWYEDRFQVEKASVFRAGDGVVIDSRVGEGPGRAGLRIVTRTVLAVEGATLRVDRRLGRDFRVVHGARVRRIHSALVADGVQDIEVAELRITGDPARNDFLDGNDGAGLYLADSRDVLIRDVEVHSFLGDGFSIQVCNGIRLVRCRVSDCAALGIHVGSGSNRVELLDCSATGGREGLYLCWGAHGCRVKGGSYSENSDYGLSLGFRDHDNLIESAIIERNGQVGVMFRAVERVEDGPHGCVLRGNLIRDNGEDGGTGLFVSREALGLRVEGNRFVSTGRRQPIAIRVHPENEGLLLLGNSFVGTEEELVRALPLKQRLKAVLHLD